MAETSPNRRIAKNTLMLYIRMLFNMAIGFYTSRIVLEALGVNDYGIFNLVGGIIIMANVLSSSFVAGTSRFITFSLGKGDQQQLKRTFDTALWIHLFLTLIFLLIAETVGLWFINTHLNIAPQRMVAANWVYQAALLSMGLGITQAPYTALLTSHERFDIFAYVEIGASVAKLAIAFIILTVESDRLILYAVLYASLSVIVMLLNRGICRHFFKESHGLHRPERPLLRQMLSFSGWNMTYTVSSTLSSQSHGVLLNWFFGTMLNAAAGIASQVQGALYPFISNVTAAFQPQITKSYAIGDFSRVNFLINTGARFSSLLTLAISIPIIIKMDYLMGLWLTEVPEGAVFICRMLLVSNFFNSFNPLVYFAVFASNRIKWTCIGASCIMVIMPVIFYFTLRLTHSYEVMYSFVPLSCILTQCVYSISLKSINRAFKLREYIFSTVCRVTALGIATFSVCYICSLVNIPSLLSVALILAVSVLSISALAYLTLLDNAQREMLRNKLSFCSFNR